MASEMHAELRTADGRPPRVAIVDGNRAGAMVTTVLLEAFGCWPLPVATAEAALALIRRDSHIDLVLVDLALPDMDGIVMVQLIQALGRDLPIVGLAGKRSELAATRNRAAGLNGILVKPYSPGELYNALVSALRRVGTAAMFHQ
jgi:CheY-like chemotaxis protein